MTGFVRHDGVDLVLETLDCSIHVPQEVLTLILTNVHELILIFDCYELAVHCADSFVLSFGLLCKEVIQRLSMRVLELCRGVTKSILSSAHSAYCSFSKSEF
jgi:hypothetical protein